MAETPYSSFRRYLPGALVLCCALTLGVRTSDQPSHAPVAFGHTQATGPTAAPNFKSPYRRERAAKAPAFRRPVIVTNTDEMPITLGEARRLREENLSFPLPSSRSRPAAAIIRRLCGSGFTAEAFASIEAERSEAREAEITAFFLTARLDDNAMLDKIRGFKERGDTSAALRAYLKRLPLDALRLLPAEDPALAPVLRQALTAHFHEKLSYADQRDQAIPIIEELHAKGLLDDELVSRKIAGEPATDVFTKWEPSNKRFTTPAEPISRDMWDE